MFCDAEDSSARVAGTRPRLYRALVDIDNTENPEDEVPTPKSLEMRTLRVQGLHPRLLELLGAGEDGM